MCTRVPHIHTDIHIKEKLKVSSNKNYFVRMVSIRLEVRTDKKSSAKGGPGKVFRVWKKMKIQGTPSENRNRAGNAGVENIC